MASSRAAFSRTASRARTTAGACSRFLQSSMLRMWRRPLFWRSHSRARAPGLEDEEGLFGLEAPRSRPRNGPAPERRGGGRSRSSRASSRRRTTGKESSRPTRRPRRWRSRAPIRRFLGRPLWAGMVPSGRIEAVDPPRRQDPRGAPPSRVQLAVADARGAAIIAPGRAAWLVRLRGIAEEKPRPRGSRQPAGFASCRAGRVHSPPTGARTEAAPGHRAALSGQPATTSDTLVTCRLLTGEGRPKIEDRPGGSARRAGSAPAHAYETLAGPYGRHGTES